MNIPDEAVQAAIEAPPHPKPGGRRDGVLQSAQVARSFKGGTR